MFFHQDWRINASPISAALSFSNTFWGCIQISISLTSHGFACAFGAQQCSPSFLDDGERCWTMLNIYNNNNVWNNCWFELWKLDTHHTIHQAAPHLLSLQDARSVKIKKNGTQTKFKIRCTIQSLVQLVPVEMAEGVEHAWDFWSKIWGLPRILHHDRAAIVWNYVITCYYMMIGTWGTCIIVCHIRSMQTWRYWEGFIHLVEPTEASNSKKTAMRVGRQREGTGSHFSSNLHDCQCSPGAAGICTPSSCLTRVKLRNWSNLCHHPCRRRRFEHDQGIETTALDYGGWCKKLRHRRDRSSSNALKSWTSAWHIFIGGKNFHKI